jgi:hypothetical protein
LALPILPSLQPRSTWAQGAIRPKRFIAFATGHGGVAAANMYPGDAGYFKTGQYVDYRNRTSVAQMCNSDHSLLCVAGMEESSNQKLPIVTALANGLHSSPSAPNTECPL